MKTEGEVGSSRTSVSTANKPQLSSRNSQLAKEKNANGATRSPSSQNRATHTGALEIFACAQWGTNKKTNVPDKRRGGGSRCTRCTLPLSFPRLLFHSCQFLPLLPPWAVEGRKSSQRTPPSIYSSPRDVFTRSAHPDISGQRTCAPHRVGAL